MLALSTSLPPRPYPEPRKTIQKSPGLSLFGDALVEAVVRGLPMLARRTAPLSHTCSGPFPHSRVLPGSGDFAACEISVARMGNIPHRWEGRMFRIHCKQGRILNGSTNTRDYVGPRPILVLPDRHRLAIE